MRPVSTLSRAARTLALPGALLLSQLVFFSAGATAADPFYLGLLRDGSRALQAGEHAAASQLLRLACFGLLEEPKVLAGCLVELSLAQAGLGERDEFESTFDRVADLEQRFQAFSEADLTDELRDAFADRAVAWIPAVDLGAISSLAAAYARKTETEVAGLPPAQRRQRLNALQSADPSDVRWSRLLAELELSEGNAAAAETAAAAVLQLDPTDTTSRCVLGRSRAALGTCEQALIDLPACAGTANAAEATIDRLGCLSSLSRWDEATALVNALPPDLSQDPRVRRLAKRVQNEQAKLSAQALKASKQAAAEQERIQREAERQAQADERTRQQLQRRVDGPPTAAPTAPPNETAPASTEPSTVPSSGPSTETSAGSPSDPGADPRQGPGATKPAGPSRVASEPQLSANETSTLERARSLARAATLIPDLAEPMRLARPVADRHPRHRGAQHLVAEIAYRASDWATAVRYFDRGGDPNEPILLFYQAIALYESGDRPRAAQAIRRSLDGLKRDPWVDSYVERILGATGSR
jgi:tetratricopeptide (TPR) repeat protein